MARPKKQAYWRAELVDAGQRAINARGVADVRFKDVAAEANVSTGLVHYYFPDMNELVFAIHRRTFDDYIDSRSALLTEEMEPAEMLRKTIRRGPPASHEDGVFTLFYELHSLAVRSAAHAELMATL